MRTTFVTQCKILTLACMCLVVLSSCGKDDPVPPSTTYAVKGRIAPKAAEDVSGVTITVGTKTATTAVDGVWSIADFAAGTYAVTPVKTDQTFDPATRSVVVSSADIVNVDFVMSGPSAGPTHPTMIEVQPGTFMQGATPGQMSGGLDARPRHQVTLTKGFFIAESEVTQVQYERVMGSNPSVHINPDGPVETLTILEMLAYCNALSTLEGLQPPYTLTSTTFSWDQNANGYRLPTEAEWEYAARAGDTNNTYDGINDGKDPNPLADRLGWYRMNSATPPDYHPTTSKPRSVKLKKPNSLGLYDVLGNVWDIVIDGFATYTSDVKTDPVVPPDFLKITGRGGGCGEASAFLTVATREGFNFSSRAYTHGFRIVRNR